jgi:2-methylisocitrate lyase-like PEP mutase family enzyme
MVLAAIVGDGEAAKAALEAGADAVIVEGLDAADAAKALSGLGKGPHGARVASLDEAGAQALKDAGCDFVISPLETTASTAVDTDAMGHVVEAGPELSDTALRALAPLGLDALYAGTQASGMTMAAQLELVRLASFASAALIAVADAGAPMAELRVLRDSGVGVVALPAETGADAIKAFGERLQAVPAPRRGKRDGAEMAIVPAGHAGSNGHEEDDDDEDDD